MFDLTGKVALITGSARGLGRDMAETLAKNGASIIITSREEEKAVCAAEEIHQKYGVNTFGARLDVTDIADIERLYQLVSDKFQKVDILINNAGGGSGASKGNLFERNVEDIVSLINTNLVGVIFMCKIFGKGMIDNKGGKIINIGSIAGIVGRDRSIYHHAGMNEQPVDYAAAKGGIIALTRDLAGLMSPYGVQVNCISPGGFRSANLSDCFNDEYSQKTMLGRMGTYNRDLNGAALFLSSQASDYITGHNLVVDGGFSVWK